jgi:hypothetical protein
MRDASLQAYALPELAEGDRSLRTSKDHLEQLVNVLEHEADLVASTASRDRGRRKNRPRNPFYCGGRSVRRASCKRRRVAELVQKYDAVLQEAARISPDGLRHAGAVPAAKDLDVIVDVLARPSEIPLIEELADGLQQSLEAAQEGDLPAHLDADFRRPRAISVPPCGLPKLMRKLRRRA